MKIIDIVGARPQFIKVAPLLRSIDNYNRDFPEQAIEEILVHTGQHYDFEMSQVFFEELGLKSPDFNLGVGSGTHGSQTGEMLKRIEEVLLDEKPGLVIVYGDTNSTLAGALAAAKLHIPVAHVEAGLRSFNREMPEEHNRVLTDHCSDLLFCPTMTAVANLHREGFRNILNSGRLLPLHERETLNLNQMQWDRNKPLVINVGDIMYDSALLYLEFAEQYSEVLEKLGLTRQAYALATLHRAENTDKEERLRNIFKGLEEIGARGLPVILPVHPRTRKALANIGIKAKNVTLIDPVSYMDMLMLEKNARIILTDSGGVQKEAYYIGVPCVTMREETEWVETVEAGMNVLVGCDPDRIVQEALRERQGRDAKEFPYGDGMAAERITKLLMVR